MKLLLVVFFLIGIQPVLADQGTFVDEVQFIQYLDENTALEEVKNGNYKYLPQIMNDLSIQTLNEQYTEAKSEYGRI